MGGHEEIIPESRLREYGIDLLNTFLKNKKSVYDFLTNIQHLYLPSFKSRAITEEYLLSVLKKKKFILNRDDVHPAPDMKIKASSLELIEEIKGLVSEKELGFDITVAPDRIFLINVNM